MHTYVYAVYKIVHNKIIFVVIIYFFPDMHLSFFLQHNYYYSTNLSAILDDIISS